MIEKSEKIVRDLVSPNRIDRLPDKVIVLMSSGHNIEQGYTIKRIELRLYIENLMTKHNPYSIITTFIETDKGSIERIFDEGFRGPDALEMAASYLTSHPILSEIIFNSITRLKKITDTQP